MWLHCYFMCYFAVISVSHLSDDSWLWRLDFRCIYYFDGKCLQVFTVRIFLLRRRSLRLKTQNTRPEKIKTFLTSQYHRFLILLLVLTDLCNRDTDILLSLLTVYQQTGPVQRYFHTLMSYKDGERSSFNYYFHWNSCVRISLFSKHSHDCSLVCI